MRTRRDGALVLGVSLMQRIGLASVGVIMAAVMISVGESSLVGIAIVVICVLGAAVEDSWLFVPTDGTIFHRRGIALIHSAHRYDREEIAKLRVRELGSSLARFRFVALELVPHEGPVVRIELQKRRDGGLVNAASLVGRSLGVPVEEEFLSDAES